MVFSKLKMIIGFILFTIELSHIIAHIITATGILTPTREYIVENLSYFYFDAISVILCFIYTRKMFYFCLGHVLLHSYFIINWNKSSFCKR